MLGYAQKGGNPFAKLPASLAYAIGCLLLAMIGLGLLFQRWP
jgi:hypothetical protein